MNKYILCIISTQLFQVEFSDISLSQSSYQLGECPVFQNLAVFFFFISKLFN